MYLRRLNLKFTIMQDPRFIETIDNLKSSVIEFSTKPELWRNAVGPAPVYFVHLEHKGSHLFGLSKFCAFKDISIESYIYDKRHKTHGGTTQKHISKLTGLEWLPIDKADRSVKNAFTLWIHSFYPTYYLNKASLISIK